jgi:murein DD-endopeptidase MepM/ murein hydrolase activator NlpD
MGSVDVQRLLLQVDASVELAKRNMRDLRGAIDQDTNAIDNALGRVEKSHARMGQQLQKTGQFRGGLQQLSFQVGDVSQQMALGVSGSRIFIQQSGQVIQALQLMTTNATGFLAFLAGPWGIALLTGATLLSTILIPKLFATKDAVGDLVEKMREQAKQADLNRQADEAWKRTIEGLTDAIRRRREEQSKSLQTDIQAEQESLDQAKAERDRAERDLATKRAELARAEQELGKRRSLFNNNVDPQLSSMYRTDLAAQQRIVDRLKGEVAALERGAATAAANVRGAEIPIAERHVEVRVDAVAAATDRYTATLGRLRKELQAGRIDQAAFERELEKARRKRDADIEAANQAKRQSTSGTGELSTFILPVSGPITSGFGARTPPTKGASSFHPAIDIGAPLGTPVKAAAAGVVIYTGRLGGLGNVVIVDHGGGTITEYGHLSKILTQKGASVGQGAVIAQVGSTGISTGPHLDYRVKVGGKYVDPRTGRFPVDSIAAGMKAGNAATKAADTVENQNDTFASQLQQLEGQLLSAQAELVQGIQQQADFAKQQVDADQKRFELAVQNDVNDGRLREEQGALLIEKSKAVALQRKANIDARLTIQQLEEQQRNLDQEAGFRVEALRYADQIARSQAEHRRIQLQIIDALYAQREADLRIAKAKAEAAGNAEEANRIQGQIDQLPAQRSREEDMTRRSTMSPLERWADGVPQTAAEVDAAFEEIAVHGINGAIDALTALTGGFGSFRDAALSAIRAVLAELIRMQLMRLALNLIPGLGGAGAAAGAAGSASAVASSATAIGNFGLPGFASGGMFVAGGFGGVDSNVLSINGVPRVRVSADERIAVIPRVGVPKPANSNVAARSGGDVHIHAPMTFNGPVRDGSRTGLQAASALRREMGRAARRGA